MAKKWKIVIGVAVALVIIACVAVPIVGVVLFRERMPKFGVKPGEIHRWMPEETWHHEAEVELIDDDGDGVPDRGVIELPEETSFGQGRFIDRRFGRFGPGHRMEFGGRAFGLFFCVGGLFRLALLAGVVTLGIVFYRKWRKAHPKAG